MAKYILTGNKFFTGALTADGEAEYKVKGDVVELTDAQAKAFADLFIAVEVAEAKAKVAAMIDTTKKDK